MKHCTICQKELPTGLDEFGPVQAVLCKDCYFESGHTVESQIKNMPLACKGTIKLQKYIESLKRFDK